MKIKDVYILKEAVKDLHEGRSFYDLQEPGIGDYFWDCIITDIELGLGSGQGNML